MERLLIGFVAGVACSYLITVYVYNKLADGFTKAMMVTLALNGMAIIKKEED